MELSTDNDLFERYLDEVFDRAQSLMLKKHHDYGPKNITNSPGGPLNGLRVRMHDKLARINNLIDSGAEPENESLRDSFVDLLNYSAIAVMVLDGTWPGTERQTQVKLQFDPEWNRGDTSSVHPVTIYGATYGGPTVVSKEEEIEVNGRCCK